MSEIEVGRISSVDMVKDLGKVASGGFYQKVIVIVHQAVNMEDGSVAMVGGFKVGEKPFSVPLVLEDGFPLVSTGGHMVKGIRKINPQGSCQADLSKTFYPSLSNYLIYVKS